MLSVRGDNKFEAPLFFYEQDDKTNFDKVPFGEKNRSKEKSRSLFAKHVSYEGYVPEYRLTKKTFFNLSEKPMHDALFNRQICEKNLMKALKEHRQEFEIKALKDGRKDLEEDPYVTLDELIIMEAKETESVPLILSHPMIASEKGNRETNEDTEFAAAIKCIYSSGTIFGIFDGHGGSNISNFAKEVFAKIFQVQLTKRKGDVRIAFENTFREIQKEIYRHKEWRDGSVAIICYVDQNNLLYSATLGDSEANIYRMLEEDLKSIPLSVVRNLKSRKEALRTIRTNQLILNDDPKKQRLRNIFKTHSVNVSRALGDVDYYYEGNGVIQRPKVSVIKLRKGDVIVLKCDGVIDSLEESEIVKIIKYCLEQGVNVANDLVLKALQSSHYSNDNVSVIAICVS